MGKIKGRVSLQDVADSLKLHLSTVSLAMRDDLRIAAATRTAVKTTAARLGYKSNPLVSAWLRQVRQPKTSQAGVCLAFLLGTAVSPETETDPYYKILVEGARAEARALGYIVNETRFGLDHERKLLRIVQQLRFRGVRGVVILDPDEILSSAVARSLEKDFAVVALLRCGGGHRFHFVGTNLGQNTTLALSRLREQGCRRIAFPVNRKQVYGLRRYVLSSYLCEQQNWAPDECLPLPEEIVEFDPKRFLSWVREVRPDSILSVNPALHDTLRKAGYQMPKDLVYAQIGTDARPELLGVDNRGFEIGRAAVFKLAGLLSENRIGVPDIPLMTLVPGLWSEPSGKMS